MKEAIILILLVIIASCNKVDRSPLFDLQADAGNGGIRLPEGFGATVFADTLGRARHIAVNKNGNVYINLRSLKDGKGLVALKDDDEDGHADQIAYFEEVAGTGIGIYNDHLYYSTDSSVYRVPLSDNELVPSAVPELMVSGLVDRRQHAAKTFTFDDEGNIYINVGAPANACQEQMRSPGSPGIDPCPLLEISGGIWRFDARTPGQTQMEDGHRFSTGIRNAVAIDFNRNRRKVYVLQHGRDQLYQFFPELYSQDEGVELPAEEFFMLYDGADFGWPYCYYDQLQNNKVLAPEYGGDGIITGRCEDKEDPIMAFPGHWGPNALLFYTGDMFPERYRNGAFIAFHGSWNRAPEEQKGYNVVFVPFEDDKPSGDYEIFADGFPGVDAVESPGDARYRPTGLAQGPDGALYVTDDSQGRVWKIFYTGQ